MKIYEELGTTVTKQPKKPFHTIYNKKKIFKATRKYVLPMFGDMVMYMLQTVHMGQLPQNKLKINV